MSKDQPLAEKVIMQELTPKHWRNTGEIRLKNLSEIVFKSKNDRHKEILPFTSCMI